MAAAKEGPCCVGVVRDSAGLIGQEVTVTELPLYFAEAKEGTSVGVVVVHDIFGFNIPNAKYIADYLAGQGFSSVVPNFYVGKGLQLEGWPATEFKEEPYDTPDFERWWGEITSDDFIAKVDAHSKAACDFLKAKGCDKFALIGFCWGGMIVERLAITGAYGSVASMHGCHSNADLYNAALAAGCKEISYHTVPGDDDFNEEAQKALKEAGAEVFVYDGMYHGFVVRGDFDNNEALKTAADRAMKSAATQFSRLSKL